ncbi:MAG: hypothetical protein QXZ12_06280 [Thermoplasmata archaeon]
MFINSFIFFNRKNWTMYIHCTNAMMTGESSVVVARSVIAEKSIIPSQSLVEETSPRIVISA